VKMTESREKYLKPLRDLLKSLETKDSVEKLLRFIEKDKFYESNIIPIIIELFDDKQVQRNANQIRGAFKLLNFIIQRKTYASSLLSRLYNYTIKEKVCF
jgi:hypothetical protein